MATICDSQTPPDTVFSYSYTARLPFREAKRRGMRCVLGQIDPGPIEHDLVERHVRAAGDPGYVENRPPAIYWEEWREEVALADTIIVNSAWSAQLLEQAGVPKGKLVEIPLVYEAAQGRMATGKDNFECWIRNVELGRTRPSAAPRADGLILNDGLGMRNWGACARVPRSAREFPISNFPFVQSTQAANSFFLHVLFLGQVIPRKGIYFLFDAIRALKGDNVFFTIAGPVGVKIPADIAGSSRVRIMGPVNRACADKLYSEADVFVLPTLSDGFAITQLEAQAHGVPVIASRNCGRVVEDGVNGILLPEVSAEAIVAAIRKCLDSPGLLAQMSAAALKRDSFSLEMLADKLLE